MTTEKKNQIHPLAAQALMTLLTAAIIYFVSTSTDNNTNQAVTSEIDRTQQIQIDELKERAEKTDKDRFRKEDGEALEKQMKSSFELLLLKIDILQRDMNKLEKKVP